MGYIIIINNTIMRIIIIMIIICLFQALVNRATTSANAHAAYQAGEIAEVVILDGAEAGKWLSGALVGVWGSDFVGYSVLYYDILYSTLLYYTILHYTTLYYLYYTILYYTIIQYL